MDFIFFKKIKIIFINFISFLINKIKMSCQAITQLKIQCSRNVENGKQYCWQHQINNININNPLINLPKDLFREIGKFINIEEGINANIAGIDKLIYQNKDCIIIEET